VTLILSNLLQLRRVIRDCRIPSYTSHRKFHHTINPQLSEMSCKQENTRFSSGCEMTYTLSSGTLNSSIPYHTIPDATGSRFGVCDLSLSQFVSVTGILGLDLIGQEHVFS